MKKYILFAFGDYDEKKEIVNLILDFVTQISTTDVKYQYGETGVLVTFTSESKINDISNFFEKNIVSLTSMYFVFPVDKNSIVSMEDEMHEHLFGKINETSNGYFNENNVSISYYFNEDNDSLNEKMAEELFKTLFQTKVQEKTLSLDEILDKINDKGFESLSSTELKTLEKYSNQ